MIAIYCLEIIFFLQTQIFLYLFPLKTPAVRKAQIYPVFAMLKTLHCSVLANTQKL